MKGGDNGYEKAKLPIGASIVGINRQLEVR